MVDDEVLPLGPLVKISTILVLKTLDTVSELALDQERHSEEKLLAFKNNANEEIDRRKDCGDGDRWYDRKTNFPPKIGDVVNRVSGKSMLKNKSPQIVR